MKLEAIIIAVFFFIFGAAAVGYFSKKKETAVEPEVIKPPAPLQSPPQYIYQPIVYVRRGFHH